MTRGEPDLYRGYDDPVTTPPLIKRNTLLLASSQAFTGAGMQFVFGLGPLMVVALMGSPILVGLAGATLGLSRFLAAYPFGRITDAYGRRVGLLLGLVIGLVGTVLVGIAMSVGSFVAFLAAFLVFGAGMNGAMQLRVAAADMYPPNRRAEALGYVVTGSLVGVVVSPLAVVVSDIIAPPLGVPQLAMPWFLVPVFILPAMYLVTRLRPDPREIARDLVRYYPDYKPTAGESAHFAGRFGFREFMGDRTRRVAVTANVAAQGNMAMAMVTTPLMLVHHGSSLPAIVLSMCLHTAGMFGLSIPLGRLSDQHGRRPVMLGGIAVEGVGSLISALSFDHVTATLGVVLIGLGWSAINVSSTALIVDTSPLAARGRAIGVNDSLAAGAGFVCALLVGPLTVLLGLPAVAVFALALMAPAAVLVFGLRDRAPAPGPLAERLRHDLQIGDEAV